MHLNQVSAFLGHEMLKFLEIALEIIFHYHDCMLMKDDTLKNPLSLKASAVISLKLKEILFSVLEF